MTATSLAVVPPAASPLLPTVHWRVNVAGREVVPGAPTSVDPGPVPVTLQVEALVPGTRVEATIELTVGVRDGGPTTVVVRWPLPPLLSTRERALG